jgi:hypothetical protein
VELSAKGFPRCNWTILKACRGFAKPFAFFARHTDPGGIAIVGRTTGLTGKEATPLPGAGQQSLPASESAPARVENQGVAHSTGSG